MIRRFILTMGLLVAVLAMPAKAAETVVKITVNGENQPVVLGLGRQTGLCKWTDDQCVLTEQRSAVMPSGRVNFDLPEDGGKYAVQIALNGSQTPLYSPILKPGLNRWDLKAAIVQIEDASKNILRENMDVRLFNKSQNYGPLAFTTKVLPDGRVFLPLLNSEDLLAAGIYTSNVNILFSDTLKQGEQVWKLEDVVSTSHDAQAVITTIDPKDSAISAIWANNGQDKVVQDELRKSKGENVISINWDGETIRLFGAKNEVLGLNLILEAADKEAKAIQVKFDQLTGPDGYVIGSRPVGRNEVFNFIGRNIELFYIRYLQIRGVSRLVYEPDYDERHVPIKLQLPYRLPKGKSSGKFEQRPNANKYYPDIAVPMELVNQFSIAKGHNQGVWADVYIPSDAPAGKYTGTVTVYEMGQKRAEIPVQLNVFPFALPDVPTAKTMIYFSQEDVNDRYVGHKWPQYNKLSPAEQERINMIWYNHHKLAHRHKFSLIDDGNSIDPDRIGTHLPWGNQKWVPILSGELFTPKYQYEGPWQGGSSGVYSIGTYASWRRVLDREVTKDRLQKYADRWVMWFEKEFPDVEYFLYLYDEPRYKMFEEVERWAQWIKDNPNDGQRLPTLVTKGLVGAKRFMPTVDIAFDGWGDPDKWRPVIEEYWRRGKPVWAYNGKRPKTGSFAIEDEGVALRTLGWIHYKHRIARWFAWQATHYKNTSHEKVETNVFETAWTFGRRTEMNHPKYGETGSNYSNGDGVLFYPGTEKRFEKENYGIDGPIASLRLKLWRRGIQDHDYLKMAARYDSERVDEIVQSMIPKVMWEVGVSNKKDPTYVHTDISWPVDPDVWEKARAELAQIIIEGMDEDSGH